MKVLAISGVIGWDVNAEDVRAFLDETPGEDIEVQISSPGGYVYPGLEIYNLLKNHDGRITIRLMGLAASMASYIAMVGDYIIAEDNAVFMIHNASGFAVGDHSTMRKAADVMEGLSNLLAKKYMDKTGKSLEDVKALMDAETFLFGDEIKKAGFVDEIAKTEKEKDKSTAVALATVAITDCRIKMKASEQEKEDLEKAAAFLNINTMNRGGEQKADGTWKYCVCSKCNYWEQHTAGKPCGKCPKCKTQMHGTNTKPTKGGKGVDNLTEILAIEDVKERRNELDAFFGALFDADRETMVKEALMSSKKTETDETLKQTVEDLQNQIKVLKDAGTIKSDGKLDKVVLTLRDDVKVLQDKLEVTQKTADSEREARRMLEIKASLQEKEIVGDIEKMTKTVFTLEKMSPELATDMINQFQDMSNKLKAAGIFSEIGSGSEGKAESAYEKLKAKVEESLKADSNITPAKAWKSVIRDNSELYKEYLKER